MMVLVVLVLGMSPVDLNPFRRFKTADEVLPIDSGKHRDQVQRLKLDS